MQNWEPQQDAHIVNYCDGRGGEIRTHDPLYPKQVRYQTAPRPDAALISHFH